MELKREMLNIDSNFEIDDDQRIVTAHIETWFDVDEKFGTNTNDDADAWVNLYANYNFDTDELTCEYIVSRSDNCMDYEYIPTETEAELIKEMMQDTCQQHYGCTLKEYATSIDMTM